MRNKGYKALKELKQFRRSVKHNLFYLEKNVSIVRFGNLLLFYINFYIYCLEEKGTVYPRRMDQGGASSTVKGNFWTISCPNKKNGVKKELFDVLYILRCQVLLLER